MRKSVGQQSSATVNGHFSTERCGNANERMIQKHQITTFMRHVSVWLFVFVCIRFTSRQTHNCSSTPWPVRLHQRKVDRVVRAVSGCRRCTKEEKIGKIAICIQAYCVHTLTRARNENPLSIVIVADGHVGVSSSHSYEAIWLFRMRPIHTWAHRSYFVFVPLCCLLRVLGRNTQPKARMDGVSFVSLCRRLVCSKFERFCLLLTLMLAQCCHWIGVNTSFK